MQNIFRNRNPPLVLLNSFDDAILPSEMQKLYATPNTRKRRSNAFGRTDGNNNNNNDMIKEFTTDEPQRDLSTSTENQLFQQN